MHQRRMFLTVAAAALGFGLVARYRTIDADPAVGSDRANAASERGGRHPRAAKRPEMVTGVVDTADGRTGRRRRGPVAADGQDRATLASVSSDAGAASASRRSR